jgi:CO/xanthine dehydrogenase FAD-binding subunit
VRNAAADRGDRVTSAGPLARPVPAFAAAFPALFVVLWSTGFISAKYGLPYAPPLTLLLVRFALAAAFLTAVALASRATVIVRGKAGTRRVPIDAFLVDSFATAVAEGEMALGAEFPVPDDRTAGSYQKVERKVGDFATAAAAVQVSLNADGTIRSAGVALSAAGACAVRVEAAEQLLAGQTPSAELIRAATNAASQRSAPQADLRGTVEYKKHLAGVLVARGLRQALARLGVQA